jgi:hypothetical protein
MKKANPTPKDELRPEYKRSDFGKLVRGKYADKIAAASNVVLLDPEVSKAFPSDQAVNDALRSLIDIAKATARPTRRSREMEELEAAVKALTMGEPLEGLDDSTKSGLYAIRVISPGLLRSFREGEGGLIYVGMSSDLAAREFDMHFSSKNTGFSTVRRSLGAILKESLQLTARQRGTGSSKSNFTNYRFNPEGEERLTKWMREHLRVRTFPSRSYEALEKLLLPRMRPLLNLESWNPHNDAIRRLRKVCADEARGLGS